MTEPDKRIVHPYAQSSMRIGLIALAFSFLCHFVPPDFGFIVFLPYLLVWLWIAISNSIAMIQILRNCHQYRGVLHVLAGYVIGTIAFVSFAFFTPPVPKAGDMPLIQARMDLQRIGMAFKGYQEIYGHYPLPYIADKQGKPLLSWRVALLPFLEQDELYKKFHLDEPWDSPYNFELQTKYPVRIYQAKTYKNDDPNSPELTRYQMIHGNGAFLEEHRTRSLADRDDSNSIMVLESAELVPWTKPVDITYDPTKPLPELASNMGRDNSSFGSLFQSKSRKYCFLMSDCEVVIRKVEDMPPEELHSLIESKESGR
jgi:Protein of unknown function (DUF1559)